MKETQDYTPVPEPRSSAEMSSLKQDQLILLNSQRQEAAAREDLIYSLTVMGAFEEALALAETDEKKEWIQSLIDAENRPDDDRCDCEHSVDVADYTRDPQAAPVLKPVPHYQPQFRHWSRRYQQMVWLQKCQLCKHTQAIPEEIDPAHGARAASFYAAHILALKQGNKIRVSSIPTK